VAYALQDGVFQIHRLVGETSGHIGGPGACGKLAHVEGRLIAAVNRGLGHGSQGSGGGILTAGHAVVVVVYHHHGEVDVPAAAVDKMVASDGGAVTVAGYNDDGQLGIGHLHAGGVGDGAAVICVQAAGVQIVHRPAGAAHAGNDDHLVLICAGFVQRPDERLQDDAVAAAGTPHGLHLVSPEVFIKNVLRHFSWPPLWRPALCPPLSWCRYSG